MGLPTACGPFHPMSPMALTHRQLNIVLLTGAVRGRQG